MEKGRRDQIILLAASLETPKPYLSALSNYLDGTQPDGMPFAYDVEKEQWFSSNDMKDKMQEKVKHFKDLAV